MRYIVKILMLMFSFVAFGQEGNNFEPNSSERDTPKIVLEINSIICDLDSVSIQTTNPKWIKKIVALKDEKDFLIFGNQPPKAIVVYPKQKYYRNILLMLAEKKGLDINTKISEQIKKQELVIKAGSGFDRYELGSTSLLQIITDFGLSYKFFGDKKNSIYILEYKNLGLTFYFNDNNTNAFLQRIEFRKPFVGITEAGIKLGKSTMLNVEEAYGELDWGSTDGSKYWWSEHTGIEFGILRNLKLPQYPLDEELHKRKKIIEISVVNFDN